MMKDATPALHLLRGRRSSRAEIQKAWPAAPPLALFDEIFCRRTLRSATPPHQHRAIRDAVTIIYTSGTSGEPKGVVLNAGNVNHMLGCTNARLDQL